jgi:hypothetical protein
MGELPRQQATQQVSAPRLVVDIPDQRVLDGHTPSCARCVIPRRLKHLGDLPTLIDRNKLVAQIIIGGVQRKRKS